MFTSQCGKPIPDVLESLQQEYTSLLENAQKTTQERNELELKLSQHTLEVSRMNTIFFDLKAKHDAMKHMYERQVEFLKKILEEHQIPSPEINFQAIFDQHYSRLSGGKKRLRTELSAEETFAVTCYAPDGRTPSALPRRSLPEPGYLEGWCVAAFNNEETMAHETALSSCCFSKKSDRVYLGGGNLVRCLFLEGEEREREVDFDTSREVVYKLDSSQEWKETRQGGNSANVREMILSRNDKILICLGEENDSQIQFFDVEERSLLLLLSPSSSPILSFSLSPLNLLAVVDSTNTLFLYQLDDSVSLSLLSASHQELPLSSLHSLLSPLSSLSLLSSTDPSLPPPLLTHLLFLSPSLLLYTATDGLVALYDVENQTTIRKWQGIGVGGHMEPITAIAASPNQKDFFTTSSDNKIRHWSISSSRCLRTMEPSRDTIHSMRVSSDGRFLITAGRDKCLTFWEIGRYSKYATIRAHGLPITDLCVSEEGERVGSVSQDGKFKLWSYHYDDAIFQYN